MKLIRRRGTRSGVALFSIATLALAMTGLLYAHWTDTLSATVGIQTGAIDPQWTIEGTSDDGLNNFSATPGGGAADTEPRPSPDYDQWQDSSGDQTYIPLGPGQLVLENLTKDVARCTASLGEDLAGGLNDRLTITIDNGYPSYWCMVRADLHNFGTVPVMLQNLAIIATVDGQAVPVHIGSPNGFQYSVDEVMGGPVHLEISEAAWDPRPVSLDCGYQLDPGDANAVYVDFSFHIDQEARQGAAYVVEFTYDWVNWNEYDEAACNVPT